MRRSHLRVLLRKTIEIKTFKTLSLITYFLIITLKITFNTCINNKKVILENNVHDFNINNIIKGLLPILCSIYNRFDRSHRPVTIKLIQTVVIIKMFFLRVY